MESGEMSKYIDAELFVAYMSGVKQKSKLLGYILAADEDEIIRLIKKQPAADVAEVVRCKDCKHYAYADGVCRLLTNHYFPPVDMDEDDYCSKGVRKDE
jgi:hypothetical protein